jgi:hypothetical protein
VRELEQSFFGIRPVRWPRQNNITADRPALGSLWNPLSAWNPLSDLYYRTPTRSVPHTGHCGVTKQGGRTES